MFKTLSCILNRLSLCLVAFISVTACVAHSPATDKHVGQSNPAFDALFDEVMARYHLPGLALGVIENGKVTYTRTAGELIAGSGKPITSDTLFKIASNSKAMTTGVLARLVDAGKLRWDDPVIRYLPHFKMSDPWITREMQVRDLLIHNSGLREGAGDLMLWPEPNLFTRADIIAGLAHLKPVHSFRSRYDYDNLMYVVAGEVAAAAVGVPYEELVRRELFAPLQMNRCQVGEWRRDEVGNVAQPHMRQDDRNVVIRSDNELIPAITSAAAGGIRCSLNDMLAWMRMWLDPDLRSERGEPWITAAQRDTLWTAQMPIPISQRQRKWDGSRFNAYGYGWRLSDVDGVHRVAHTGTLAGMYSAVTLLPEKKTGFVLMINGEGSDARTVLNEALVKHFTAPGHSSVAYYADELAKERQQEHSESRAPDTSSRQLAAPFELKRWLGVYRDPWFGEAEICEQAGHVRFTAAKSPRLAGNVMQVGGRLLVDWDDASADAEPWLEFAQGKPDDAITLTLAKVDPDADFSNDYEDLQFTRVRGCMEGGGEMQSKIDALMHAYDGQGPGASVLVLHDGKPVVRRSYGLANVEEHAAATPATNYRLASVTKQFTAAAILLLAEEGKLRLDDFIHKWLPTLPKVAGDMTIRQVLSHMSGLIDYEDFIPTGMAAQLHDADVLKILEPQNRAYFVPGTRYRYSNSGYSLLALIVGRASGKDFAAFLRERIFMPLGMSNTVAYEAGVSTVVNRAYGYSEAQGAWERTDQSQTSAVLGDGGIYSSIDDLAKWDAALYDDRLLRKESRDLAFTPVTPTDDPAVAYAMGWRSTGETLWHSGETMGFRNVIVRYPRRRLTVIVLTNRNDPEPYRTALAIAQVFLPH